MLRLSLSFQVLDPLLHAIALPEGGQTLPLASIPNLNKLASKVHYSPQMRNNFINAGVISLLSHEDLLDLGRELGKCTH